MAHDAILPQQVLRMWSGRNRNVALQAKRVDACGQQHPRIWRSMRGVAGLASLAFHGFVLEDERSALVAMALETNHILIWSRSKLTVSQCAVGAVAVRALDQSFFHAMMERLLKIRLLFNVA